MMNPRPRLRIAIAIGRQEGFTVVETMVALGVILAALMVLAYTASIGFSDSAYAKSRQAASAFANQAMEQIRALPFDTLKKGLGNTDLAQKKDASITQSGTEYYYMGEQIPRGTNSSVVPIVPHQGTLSDTTAVTYTVSSYITYYLNNLTSNTFRVTVVVSWKAPGRASQVQTQSIFYSGTGCLSASTHPFAAPCQPFFFASSSGGEGHIDVTGTLSNSNFEKAQVIPGGYSSDMQIEQTTSEQGGSETSGVGLKFLGQDEQFVGPLSVTSGASNDPAQPLLDYDAESPPAPTAQSLNTGSGDAVLTVTASANDTGASTSTTSATISPPHLCADRSGINQTDGLPCGSSNALQGGTSSATLTITEDGKKVGTAVLASTAASVSKGVAFTDRAASPEGSVCPQASGDGCVHADAYRSLGQVTLGGLPDQLDQTSIPPGWLGYFIAVTNATSTASAENGLGSAAPAATVGGTVWVWNGLGYTSVPLTSLSVSLVAAPVHVQQLVDGKLFTVDMTASLTTGGTQISDPAGCLVPCTRNSASATILSPLVGSFTYRVTFNGQTVANLTITVDLGTVMAKGTYKPSPSS